MAKPIFLVALPYKEAHQIEYFQKLLEKKLTDYYGLIYVHNKDEIEFHAVYEKDFDEVKFEELKDLVSQNARQT